MNTEIDSISSRRAFLKSSLLLGVGGGILGTKVEQRLSVNSEIDSLRLNFNINNLSLNNLELACAALEAEMVKRNLLEIGVEQKDDKVISFYLKFIYKAIEENKLPSQALADLMSEGKIRRGSLVQFKLKIQRMLQIPPQGDAPAIPPRKNYRDDNYIGHITSIS